MIYYKRIRPGDSTKFCVANANKVLAIRDDGERNFDSISPAPEKVFLSKINRVSESDSRDFRNIDSNFIDICAIKFPDVKAAGLGIKFLWRWHAIEIGRTESFGVLCLNSVSPESPHLKNLDFQLVPIRQQTIDIDDIGQYTRLLMIDNNQCFVSGEFRDGLAAQTAWGSQIDAFVAVRG